MDIVYMYIEKYLNKFKLIYILSCVFVVILLTFCIDLVQINICIMTVYVNNRLCVRFKYILFYLNLRHSLQIDLSGASPFYRATQSARYLL